MTQDINDDTIWISDKEAANSPRFIREGISDRKSELERLGMHRINILDLDRHVWLWPRFFVPLHDGNLSCRILRGGERQHPAHIHRDIEAQKFCVELPALGHPLRHDLRHYWYDAQRAAAVCCDLTAKRYSRARCRGKH